MGDGTDQFELEVALSELFDCGELGRELESLAESLVGSRLAAAYGHRKSSCGLCPGRELKRRARGGHPWVHKNAPKAARCSARTGCAGSAAFIQGSTSVGTRARAGQGSWHPPRRLRISGLANGHK